MSSHLAVANTLFGQQGYAWAPDFLTRSQRHYGAGLIERDFRGDTEGSRRRVNTWVSERTADRIQDLIGAGQLTPLTVMVLLW